LILGDPFFMASHQEIDDHFLPTNINDDGSVDTSGPSSFVALSSEDRGRIEQTEAADEPDVVADLDGSTDGEGRVKQLRNVLIDHFRVDENTGLAPKKVADVGGSVDGEGRVKQLRNVLIDHFRVDENTGLAPKKVADVGGSVDGEGRVKQLRNVLIDHFREEENTGPAPPVAVGTAGLSEEPGRVEQLRRTLVDNLRDQRPDSPTRPLRAAGCQGGHVEVGRVQQMKMAYAGKTPQECPALLTKKVGSAASRGRSEGARVKQLATVFVKQ